MIRRAVPLAVCLCTTPALAPAQGAAPGVAEHDSRPVAAAVRTASPPRIDGRLDEPVWATAPVVDRFTQIDPQEGQPASQRTEVRVLYDDHALYIGARLHDTGPVTGRLGRRDMPLGDSDWFGVMIDSYHDHRTAFGFDVNPAGVRRDEVKIINQDDNSWDPVWDVATTVDEGGWTVEYRIPFSQLRFSRADAQTWGIQFERLIGRRNEYAVSTFIPKSEQCCVPKYGHLVGLRGIRPGKRLEVLPYTVARAEYVDPGPNPFRTDEEHGVSAGLDLKYRATSNLTLDATLNPDFGQVEVDPAVINLGVYETFFEEKRPFFVEGSEIFGFPAGTGQLFYSRRIGRAPQVGPPSRLADVPTATTILGAAKLSGKTASGWSVGVLEAMTQREDALYRDPAGQDLETVVEPFTNYFVGRARRDLRGGASSLGGMLTAVNRDLTTDLVEQRLHSAAYAAGIDFRHEWDDRAWALRGAVALSHVLGDARAITLTQRLSNHYFQRPDADHLEVDPEATSLTGMAAQVTLQRQAGEHWRGSATVSTTTPAYEVNDLGFNYRTDRRDFEAGVTYLENRPGPFLRNWNVATRARFEGNYDNQLIANWLTLATTARTLDYWTAHVMLQHSLRANDDRLTRGGPMALRPASWMGLAFLQSDARKPVTLRGNLLGERNEFGGWRTEAEISVGLKTSSRWNLSVGPTLLRQSVVAQYVDAVPDPLADRTFERRYVFAPLEQTEIGLETRFNLTFTPGLSLEMYAQPLISSGAYGAPAELEAPSTYDFRTYVSAERFVDPTRGPAYRIDPDGTGPAEPFLVPDRDFNVRSLRGNAVLRWEWRQGSTLYVAWQQSRRDLALLGDFDFGRDRRELFRAQPDNIFLIKVNYWLNP